ncbi:E3 ubiquitin-protein ligase RNF152-like [Coregonus clupeaformis]|uniref:E3 ubiquitin-protein ligase RNF152-like n=1 Tax=Coregonus clupeaformis TaxID=59861 RepID=UPI001BE0E6C6|nr:E3 ubiquitin-protein ligase RNF152-like [Coregonus clupeaformis]
MIMEPVSQQNSVLECQICLNYYNLRCRPKLLDCQHTCCSVCLTQMKINQSELRCPWCRSVTTLPHGVSVSQLPDDPDTMAVISVPSPTEYTPVFIQLPSNTCYLSVDHQERATVPGEHSGRHLLAGQPKGMSPVPVSDEERPGLGEEYGEEGCCKSSFKTRVGLVVLLGFVLLLLVYIVLYNMTCIYKRFTMISCG